MQNKLNSFNLDISHVIIFAKTCNWCFDTINFHSKESMFFFLIFTFTLGLLLTLLRIFTFCSMLLSITHSWVLTTMYKDINPPFKTTFIFNSYKSRILCWWVSLISEHKLYLLWHISDDGFGSGFKDELLFNEGGDSVRCWFLLVGFHRFLFIPRESRVLHQNSKGLLQFDLFAIKDVMSDY